MDRRLVKEGREGKKRMNCRVWEMEKKAEELRRGRDGR